MSLMPLDHTFDNLLHPSVLSQLERLFLSYKLKIEHLVK